uniref:Uncharacterized protein n=1 Tax=Plectus sambesii TaxID=2011161 RepID=A0A914VXS7_9BILA
MLIGLPGGCVRDQVREHQNVGLMDGTGVCSFGMEEVALSLLFTRPVFNQGYISPPPVNVADPELPENEPDFARKRPTDGVGVQFIAVHEWVDDSGD